jgi:NAD(P)-dependent dehydrogenase (short-subunit alcohol dehydrogenase family)
MFEVSESKDLIWGETVLGSQMLFGLHGKVAVVTGGGRGLGAATAETFARAGASVVLVDVAGEYARAKADHIRSFGGIAHAVSCDVTDESAVKRSFDKVVADFGGLDVLVNNAGRAVRKPAMDLAMDDWQKVIDLNLTAVFACSRTAARHMKAHGGGAIVNVASVMGVSGGLFPNASYQASKGGVINLTRALALEWAADNIRVNAVAPTFVQTELTAPVFSNPVVMGTIMANTPLGRLPEPEDIAAAILYLASPAAHCVTGVVLPVDSGYLAR